MAQNVQKNVAQPNPVVGSRSINKSGIIEGYRKHSSDTGSTEVQIALMSARITSLTEHFKKHKKDFGSKRGLLMLVGERRSALRYLQRTDAAKYKEVIERLGIRK